MREKYDEGESSGVGSTMTGGSLGLRTGSYGSLQQQAQNGGLQAHNLFISRKPSKLSLSGTREKERFVCCLFRHLGRRKVGMLILVSFALLAFMAGFFSVNRGLYLGYCDIFLFLLFSFSFFERQPTAFTFDVVCLEKLKEILLLPLNFDMELHL